MTVLVVEDDAELARLYANWLKESYEIRVAHDCTTAYEQFDESIDVALLDRNLPDGSGDDVLREVRRIGLDWRVAMVTGKEPTLDIVEMGFDDYLCKPVSNHELRAVVDRLVAHARYGDVVAERYRLSAKQALLETHLSQSELEANGEYTTLMDRQTELDERLTEMVETLSETQFLAETAKLGSSSPNA